MAEQYPTDAELNALSGTTQGAGILIPEKNKDPNYVDLAKVWKRIADALIPLTGCEVYKDGDLTFAVRAGKYFNGDTAVNYAGASAQALTNNATNRIYLTADGTLTVNTTGFPVPSVTPHIPLAEIVTASGNYSIDDGDIDGLYRQRSMLQVCGAESVRELTIYNSTGAQIDAGEMLHIKGWNAANSCYDVELADADTVNKPAQLVATANIANAAVGVAADVYDLTGQNTDAAAAVGDPVYLSTTAGGWTLTKPTGADQIAQEIGYVTVKHAATGAIRFIVSLAGNRETIGTTGIADLAVTTAKLAANAATVAKLADAVQDLMPNLNITAEAEVGNERAIIVQVRDAANNNMTERFLVRVWVSDGEYEAPDATDNTVTVAGGTLYETETANAAYKIITAAGRVEIGITIAGAATRYIMAEIDGRIYSSGQVDWAA